MNDALRRALADARLREVDVAAALGVDPKTVQRWLAGRVPHPRHRWATADLLRVDERELWPEQDGPLDHVNGDVKAIYPYRSAVPREVWRCLFAQAERQIDILAYAALFLAEDFELVRLIADRAQSGVTVRLLLGDPRSSRMADRGIEEGIGETAVAARVCNAISLLRPLFRSENVSARQHECVLYNSIFRADDRALINPQVYGIAAAFAPVFHLEVTQPGGLFKTYTDCFERVWTSATPCHTSRH